MRSDLLTANPLRKKGDLGGEGIRVAVNNAMGRSAKCRAVITQTLPLMEKWLERKIGKGTA